LKELPIIKGGAVRQGKTGQKIIPVESYGGGQRGSGVLIVGVK
jgi:hypothetical protein